MPESDAYKDADTLRRLYWDEELTQGEIADRFDKNPGTIHYWMEKHGIERRDRLTEISKSRQKGDRLITDGKGYVCWRYGRHNSIKIHRLIAVAKYGFDAVADRDVHHVSGVPFDNRRSNITVLTPEEHHRLHAEEQSREDGGEFS